jgi:hypothetical protein
VELVIGAAVMCEAKATFIQNIFSLNHESQTALKGHIEQVMQRMQDYDNDDEGEGGDGGRERVGSRADSHKDTSSGVGAGGVAGKGGESEELIR